MSSRESMSVPHTTDEGRGQAPLDGVGNAPSASEHNVPTQRNKGNEEFPTPLAPANSRLRALLAKKANLETTLASLKAQRSNLVEQAKLHSDATMPADWSEDQKATARLSVSTGIIKDHIARLQKYNEIKDIGQGLMGLIAEERNVRIGRVMEEFGMSEKD